MTRIIIIQLVIVLSCLTGISQNNELNLMPWPQQVNRGEGQHILTPDFKILVVQGLSDKIDVATTKFLRRLSGRSGVFIESGFAYNISQLNTASLVINYNRIGKLEINEDESYQLQVDEDKISIRAETDIGVVYALETLLQILSNNDTNYFFPAISIVDNPRFTWRGLMIDVARHFEPVAVIKRNLDAMAAVKMNVFHWHLTDDQGFRVESKTHPKLHELGSDGQYYTQNQIKDIVDYAGQRGIRVLPEFDVPGHATAILTAYPEIGSKDTTYTIERFAGIFHPTLDPTNEKTYEILDDLFGEMSLLFPYKYFHIGGDENAGKHWDENDQIQNFKKKHDLDTNHDLQTYFNIRIEEILNKYGKSLMGWEEIMTDKMPTTALIHSWKGVNEGVKAGQSLVTAAKKGHNTVLSNGYYIDLMQPVTEHYLVDPMPPNNDLTPIEKARILGGEATMWSELVTPLTIDSRLWPRTIAIAERFWSPAEVRDISSMYKRMEPVSFRLEELGITHIRNRDVILRNISNNQNIEPLLKLTKVYEPLKIYTRNKGGTEYKSYSPFTLFADACSSDASDAIIFNNLVTDYSETKNTIIKGKIIAMLQDWVDNHQQFLAIQNPNPILKNVGLLSSNIEVISKSLITILNEEKIKSNDTQILVSQYLKFKEPVVDVEPAVADSFKKLMVIFSEKNSFENELHKRSIPE